jgi:hypothetical protein
MFSQLNYDLRPLTVYSKSTYSNICVFLFIKGTPSLENIQNPHFETAFLNVDKIKKMFSAFDY